MNAKCCILIFAGILFGAYILHSQEYIPVIDSQTGAYGYKSGDSWANDFRYVNAQPFSEGFAAVQEKKKWGYINSGFDHVYPFVLDEALPFKEGYAAVSYNGKWGMLDKNMQCALPFKYDEIQSFSYGLAAVRSKKSWDFIGRDFTFVTDAGYEDVRPCSEGLAAVKLNGKWGYIDRYGQMVIPFRYDEVTSFSDGFAAVKLNGKWGYIDSKTNCVIPYRYEDAQRFSEGFAAVKMNGKWGYIDSFGNQTIPFRYNEAPGNFTYGFAQVNGGRSYIDKNGNTYSENKVKYAFSIFAKKFIEQKVNIWQQKGKYEKTADWKNRVNEKNRMAIVDSLVYVAKDRYIEERSRDITTQQRLGDYDADSEIFLIHDSRYGDLLVPVPIGDAEAFEKNFVYAHRTLGFAVENDTLSLSSVEYDIPGIGRYMYSNKASLEFSRLDINYNFDEINFDEFVQTEAQSENVQSIRNVKVSVGSSDVDINIPKNEIRNDRTFAVIIANENYQRESNVQFAANDGKAFSNYCKNTLGLPEKNVHLVVDATLNNIFAEVDWIKKVSNAYGGDASIIFYYAGHGIPDEKSQSPYLLPVDGYGSNTATGYKLSELYRELSACPSKSTLVFLDACFSGAKRDGKMLNEARGIAIKAKAEKPSGNLVIFSAAQGDETAYPFEDKGHGMFTYFLLKKLQETKGNVTLGELAEYVTGEVSKMSIVENLKSQTPTIIPSGKLSEDWATIKLYNPQ